MDKGMRYLVLLLCTASLLACDIKVPKIPNQTDQSNQKTKTENTAAKEPLRPTTVSATAKANFEACPGGISKTKTDDIIDAFGSFGILRDKDILHFRDKLGGPEFPLDSPGCYGVGYAEVIAELMPNRVVIFDRSPFDHADSGRVRNVYSRLITDFARATHGEWKPTRIKIEFNRDSGVATIDFVSFGKNHQWQIDQHEAINRVADEFFDGLVRLEQQHLKGVYFNLSRNRQAYYVYVPRDVAAIMQKMGIK